MTRTLRKVQCSAPDCTRTFRTGTGNPVHYCETCRKKQRLLTQRHFDQHKRIRPEDPIEDAPEGLNEKLDRAEFSILDDAGPKDCAFSRGAKLTAWEVHYMLKHKSIAENSILLHNHTQIRHRVTRSRRGRLTLDPPWLLAEESGDGETGRLGDWEIG